MDFGFLLNRVLFPLAGALACVWVAANGGTVRVWLEKRVEKRFWPAVQEFANSFKLDFSNLLQVGASAFSGVGLLLLVSFLFGQSALGKEPLSVGMRLFLVAFSGVIGPLAEEFVARGFLIAGFFLATRAWETRAGKRMGDSKIALFALIFSTSVFVIGHGEQTVFQLALRASSGILYGALYLAGGRNLALPVAAHASGNLAVILASP